MTEKLLVLRAKLRMLECVDGYKTIAEHLSIYVGIIIDDINTEMKELRSKIELEHYNKLLRLGDSGTEEELEYMGEKYIVRVIKEKIN